MNQSGVVVPVGAAVDFGEVAVCAGEQANRINAQANEISEKQNNFTGPSLVLDPYYCLREISNRDTNQISGVLFSHVEQALDPDKDQRQDTDTDTRPPGAQRAVKLKDGHNRTVDQNTKQSTDNIANTTR